MSNTIIQTRHLEKHFVYGQTHDVLSVIQSITCAITKGSIVVILGASGSGKSTLLHLLGGLLQPTAGTVHILGHNIHDYPSDTQRAHFINQHIGFVFQRFFLLPELTVLDNIMVKARLAGKPASLAKQEAEQWLHDFSLWHRRHYRPYDLSGGEAQRVAIMRALMQTPDIMICDEPTGNLDRHTTATVMAILRDLNQRLGHTFIIATHDEHVATLGDRVMTLEKGQLID